MYGRYMNTWYISEVLSQVRGQVRIDRFKKCHLHSWLSKEKTIDLLLKAHKKINPVCTKHQMRKKPFRNLGKVIEENR